MQNFFTALMTFIISTINIDEVTTLACPYREATQNYCLQFVDKALWALVLLKCLIEMLFQNL